ncbi:fungal-specific transcription factor domain-containing protein [Cadophora sp. MPI-SDFR-AT-0126]|nr:fungal-specific transcription factor domain-containing protein [Leotiomycetes sp. MPI-SDFR-AT-0126]
MKHSASSDLESGREKAHRRQDPVSCIFCRRKKLKCDRGAPCSNCRARKLTCSSAVDGHAIQSRASTEQANLGTTSQNIDDLNARVRKIEELLTKRNPLEAPPAKQQSAPLPSSTKNDYPPHDIELTKAVSWVETDAFEHTPSETEDPSTLDFKVVESFGSFIFSLTRPRMAPAFNTNLPTLLPSRSQGEVLLEYYFDNVNWLYHIIHKPTVRKIFDAVYTDVERGRAPDYGHLSLIATLFALSAYFCGPNSDTCLKYSDAMNYSRRWTLLAQESLSAANCLAHPTVETLQSLILIAAHMMANIGAIATLRTLSATIMHSARMMSLHTLDTPRNKRLRENTTVDYVDLEVKRRLWWHIASTDWMLSFMSGAQCGTYMIHPKQMNVDYPTNVCDESITPMGPSSYAVACKYPTEMTYFLFRLRFATVFREMVDVAWDTGSDIDDLPYEIVIEFDKKLNDLSAYFEEAYSTVMKNMPSFEWSETLRADGKLVDSKSAQLIRQRNMAMFALHTRVARLHRPYLIRGAQDPRYSYSRMVCLRSARRVIELGKMMAASFKNISPIKIWSVNHHVFVSTMILVMDYCFNREEPRARERKEEILESFRLMEGTSGESTIASRGLMKLKKMLSEKGVSPPRNLTAPSHQPPPPPVTVPNSHQPFPSTTTGTLPVNPNADTNTNSATNISLLIEQLHPTTSDPAVTSFHDAPSMSMNGLSINHTSQSVPNLPAVGLQNVWPDYDYLSYEDINFDVDLDASQFEALFQGIDSTAYN